MSGKNFRSQEQFELSPNIMAIIPIAYGSKTYSKILEFEIEKISPCRPIELIKRGCRYYGSSYTARKESTKLLIGVTHKAPIVIDPFQLMYYFPTASPNQQHCAWISHEHVVRHEPIGKHETEVVFLNGKRHRFLISHHSFKVQMMRTASLRTSMFQRSFEYDRINRFLNLYLQFEALEKRKDYHIDLDKSPEE